MQVPPLPHRFDLSPAQAVAIQRRLAGRVVLSPLPDVRYVLGLDCAFEADRVLAVGVLWDLAAGRRQLVQPIPV